MVDVTCVGGPANAIPCSSYAGQNPRTNTAVLFGGTKSTSIDLSFGLGTPSMFPLKKYIAMAPPEGAQVTRPHAA